MRWAEREAKNLSEEPTGFTRKWSGDAENAEPPASAEPVDFSFPEWGETAPRNTGFVYDSEEARDRHPANMEKARAGVKQILRDAYEKAKEQAAEIKAQAEQEGREKGHAEGFEQGENQAREECGPVLESAQNLIQTLSEFRRNMYPKVEREMIEMVLALVKKIIHVELSTKEENVQEMIRLAVQSVLDKESMTIQVHPKDKEYAEKFRPELAALFGEIKNVTFEENPGIERGGCVVESNFGTVDARMDQLEAQIDKLLHLAPQVESQAESQAESPVEPQEPREE